MKLFVPQVETKDKGFSADIDIFNRKPFGEALLTLIQNTDDALVLALDAPWGAGKTTFISMWKGFLDNKQVKNVYFDAFANDYQADPFLAISSQIYSLIDDKDDKDDKASRKEFNKKAVAAMKVVGSVGLRIGIKALTAGVVDEKALDVVGDYIANELKKAAENKESLDAFKKYLAKLGEEFGTVIFIIDELDRCKPKFALSLIESIKQLFSVPNITFLLVLNRAQLEEAVRHEYGSGVDASRYLQKFVSIWISLPKVNKEGAPVAKKYLEHCLDKMEYRQQTEADQFIMHSFKDLVMYYNLSLRDIEKSLTSFAIIRNVTDGKLSAEDAFIAVFVAVIKAIKPDIYQKLARGLITYDQLLDEADLAELVVDDSWNYFEKYRRLHTPLPSIIGMPFTAWDKQNRLPNERDDHVIEELHESLEGHPVRWVLKYYLGTYDQAKKIFNEGKWKDAPLADFDRVQGRRDSIPAVCKWLETFQTN